MSDVKACPFCDKEVEVEHNQGAGTVWCETEDCCLGMVDTSNPFLDEIIAKWNKRPREERFEAALKIYKKAVEFYATDSNWGQCYEHPSAGNWHIDGCGGMAKDAKEKVKKLLGEQQ